MQLPLLGQNVCEVNRERSRLSAASSLCDSTKHNGLVTKCSKPFLFLFQNRPSICRSRNVLISSGRCLTSPQRSLHAQGPRAQCHSAQPTRGRRAVYPQVPHGKNQKFFAQIYSCLLQRFKIHEEAE